jgi:hypothetical protein
MLKKTLWIAGEAHIGPFINPYGLGDPAPHCKRRIGPDRAPFGLRNRTGAGGAHIGPFINPYG